MDRNLIQEINRLFDELVHSPWSRVPLPRSPISAPPRGLAAPAALAIEIPLKEADLCGVAVEAQGRCVTVVIRTRTSGHEPQNQAGIRPSIEESRQMFEVPDGVQPAGFEVHLEGGTLQVRIALRACGESERTR